jgi:isoquinoline 1-oxidoreductase beta subunit
VVQGWRPPGTKFLPLGGVAVIARNTGAAIMGREALKITWDDGPNKSYDSARYRAELEAAVRAPGEVVRNGGDIDAAVKSAARVMSAEYYTPTLAHVSMEPPTALVSVSADGAEAWAPVQSPGGVRADLAALLNLPIERVRLHTTLLGGGFGRKSQCDYVLEAALLSKAIGAPVQMQWTREDDIQHCFFHAENAQRIEAALDANNKVIGWRHRSAAPSIMTTFKAGVEHQASFEVQMGLVDVVRGNRVDAPRQLRPRVLGGGTCRREGRLGAQDAAGSRHGDRSAPQLRQHLRRDGGRGGGCQGRQLLGSAG